MNDKIFSKEKKEFYLDGLKLIGQHFDKISNELPFKILKSIDDQIVALAHLIALANEDEKIGLRNKIYKLAEEVGGLSLRFKVVKKLGESKGL